jgi:biotin carboxyl carrier protein
MEKAELMLRTAPVRSAIQASLFQLDFDEARAAYRALLAQERFVEDAARSAIRAAELELRDERIEEGRAAANVEKMFVRAPVSGRVVLAEIFRGADFSPIRVGDQVRPGQPYAQIVDSGSVIVEAVANQVDVEQLHIGAAAQVRFDAYSNLKVTAKIRSIGPLAQARRSRAGYVAQVPVLLSLTQRDPRLIPNLTVSADVILRRDQADGIIPHQAIFRDAEGDQPFAYVMTPAGWDIRDVLLGAANNIEVSVRSGLSAGDVVALGKQSV